MKGILFSSDFVLDNNGNERLLEINTDTAFLDSVLELIDFSDFYSVLNQNNITKVVVVYKNGLHLNFVNHLSSSLHANTPYITTFDTIEVAETNIFPSIPNDDADTFLLRLAYDESAIIDSEYAKGKLDLLKLFADNNDTESVCNFYHSSSIEGYYNTLDGTINDSNIIPDFVTKKNTEQKKQMTFYKIGKPELSVEARLNEFIESKVSDVDMIQQYHFNENSVNEDNKITSIRSFKIVYGGDLDIISLVDYQIESLFDLPVDLNSEIDNTKIDNELSDKHYYELATNFTKAPGKVLGGLLDTHEIIMADDSQKQLSNLEVGDLVKSYHISGSPMRDNPDILFAWSLNGNLMPSGSYFTSSYVEAIYSSSIANNIVSEIKIGGDVIYSAPSNVFLVYESNNDKIIFKRGLQINPSNDYLINNEGVTQSIDENNMYILNNDNHQIYEIDVEEIDTYFIAGTENIINSTFILTHNWTCFIAGTKVTMGDGSEKNIEDIVIGDEVLSYNEELGIKESKKVIQTNNPMHNDLVKYELSNGEYITSTYDHPFYVNELDLASFRPDLTNEKYQIKKLINQIKEDDVVILNNGNNVKIVSIEILPKVATQTYIITVKDNHNFYANNVLVHNK